MVRLSLILLVAGFILAAFGSLISLYFTAGGMILLLAAVWLLWRYSSRSLWKCRQCGNEKKLTWKENLTGLTVGYLEKELYCENCKKETVHTLQKPVRRKN